MNTDAQPAANASKRQLQVAVMLTAVAVMDGLVLLASRTTFWLVIEIILVACAVFQWVLYLREKKRT